MKISSVACGCKISSVAFNDEISYVTCEYGEINSVTRDDDEIRV